MSLTNLCLTDIWTRANLYAPTSTKTELNPWTCIGKLCKNELYLTDNTSPYMYIQYSICPGTCIEIINALEVLFLRIGTPSHWFLPQ